MALPPGFVYLSDSAPSIVQDIRYAGSHNFVGRPICGYRAAACVLTESAASALAGVQVELELAGLTLCVYDGYRPQRAVDDFVRWSRNPNDQRMKAEFYPNIDKARVFELGYVAAKSGHTRGSTVDLTIEAPNLARPAGARALDISLDMGTSYDCMDLLSHIDARLGTRATSHRTLLRDLMERYGFLPYQNEWWHFTLRDEPFPDTYFDFPIDPPASARSS